MQQSVSPTVRIDLGPLFFFHLRRLKVPLPFPAILFEWLSYLACFPEFFYHVPAEVLPSELETLSVALYIAVAVVSGHSPVARVHLFSFCSGGVFLPCCCSCQSHFPKLLYDTDSN